MKGWAALVAIGLLAAGCTERANLPAGADAYALIPPPQENVQLREYRILPGDQLSVIVYREPDLSLPGVQVDTAGKFSLPLLGSVDAAGRTAEELAEDIRSRLAAQYLREPKVAVNVASAASQRIVVEGSVNQPGLYDIRGETTLLGAVSLARGPTRTAALSEVAVFRRSGKDLIAAKFDIAAIRKGEMRDPEILPGDTVVVGFSQLKSAWRDFLAAAPAFAIFRPLYD
ncbi:polysaccharide biosynthesis/export family protein [Sphingomonas canadensis]|uniref:Polysaccharide biosynthesis/export family protein n=1 Tax=Sphingomonas canadensis TaxID=1219257 RepID=A0ABW3H7R6_9SPHN|nr:polysaccharide biosynthesis/export family protein [Sphingomonas canadensis]MCW3837128.1 polysaccharide export protein [Sphingomonas canadensis]